jgi:hypothetical protein
MKGLGQRQRVEHADNVAHAARNATTGTASLKLNRDPLGSQFLRWGRGS